MSVLNTRNVLVATCGAVLGCASAYAYSGANQLIALAGTVGAVALPVIYEAIYQAIPESGFKPFNVNIQNLTYLGEINNRSMFAHLALGTDDVCPYLQKMDTVEYEQVKKENAVAETALNLTGPLITGSIVTGGAMGVLIWALGPLGTIFSVAGDIAFELAYAIPLGASAGGAHHAIKRYKPEEKMTEDRANRLTTKIRVLADRIATLMHRGGYPREVIQLQIAHDCFVRHLQKYSNKIIVHRV